MRTIPTNQSPRADNKGGVCRTTKPGFRGIFKRTYFFIFNALKTCLICQNLTFRSENVSKFVQNNYRFPLSRFYDFLHVEGACLISLFYAKTIVA